MSILRLRCPAKLNLHLEVLGRRADGYHELRTVYQTIGLADDLAIEARPEGFRLHVHGDPSVPASEENLVLRAARAMREAFPDRVRGASFLLRKRIPAGGGLGGGSSDAASTIRGLAALYGLEERDRKVRRVAATIGSDVPLFLTGGTLLGSGRGERVRRLRRLPPLGVALIVPSWGLSTAEVFAALPPLTHPRPQPKIQAVLRLLTQRKPVRLRNDLEVAVRGLGRDLTVFQDALRETGALAVGMTGSGSTIFGLYRDLGMACSRVRGVRVPDTRLIVTEFLERGILGTACISA